LNGVQWERDQEDTQGIDGGMISEVLDVKNWTKVVRTDRSGMVWCRIWKPIGGCRTKEE